MVRTSRQFEELLIDCAGALRDGRIPTFVKSLTHEEAQIIAGCNDFAAAARIVRLLNSAAFGDHIVNSDQERFISRVNAKILSRLRPFNMPPRGSRGAHAKSSTQPKRIG